MTITTAMTRAMSAPPTHLMAGGPVAAPITPEPLTLSYEQPVSVSSGAGFPHTIADGAGYTPAAAQTGLVISVAVGADIPLTCTVGGTPATQISTIATDQHATVHKVVAFLSGEAGGDIVIDSTATYNVNNPLDVSLVKIEGGTIRSWTAHTTVPAIPDTNGVAVSLPGIAVDDHGVTLGHVLGDKDRTHTPLGQTLDVTDYSLAFGDLQGDAQILQYPAAATDTFSFTSNGFRTRLGYQVIALSQLPTPTLTPAEAPANFVYALNELKISASVPVSGTYTGTASAVEARVVDDLGAEVVAWATLDAAPAGGAFAGSITVPQQGLKHLRAEVRFANNPGTTYAQTGLWHVGLVVVGYGQSNMLNWEAQEESSPALSAFGSVYRADTATFRPSPGNGAAEFINALEGHAGLPVGLIVGGRSGTGITNLRSGNAPFTELSTAIAAHANGVIHAILYSGNEDDATGAITPATWASNLDALHGEIVALTGQTKPNAQMVLSSLGPMDDLANVNFTDASWQALKDQQQAITATYANIHHAGGSGDAVLLDDYHYYGRGYGRRALREAYEVARQLGDVTGSALFKIASAAAPNGTTTTVTLTHGQGTDFSVETGVHGGGSGALTNSVDGNITAFEVSDDDWATVHSCTGVHTDANTITLTHSSIATSGRKLRYQFGRKPNIAGLVIDNSAIGMPLEFVDEMAVV